MEGYYTVWHTQDGREVPLGELGGEHLVNTIHALKGQKLFADAPSARRRWLTVLKAEALRRGLDWKRPGTRRVGLVEWLCEELDVDCDHVLVARKMTELMREHGIEPPEIDLSNLTGAPTYAHWREGGSPLEVEGGCA